MERAELPEFPAWLPDKDEVKLEDGANALAVTAKAVNKAATFMMLLSSWIRFMDCFVVGGGRIR
jgi:hypothetical protein